MQEHLGQMQNKRGWKGNATLCSTGRKQQIILPLPLLAIRCVHSIRRDAMRWQPAGPPAVGAASQQRGSGRLRLAGPSSRSGSGCLLAVSCVRGIKGQNGAPDDVTALQHLLLSHDQRGSKPDDITMCGLGLHHQQLNLTQGMGTGCISSGRAPMSPDARPALMGQLSTACTLLPRPDRGKTSQNAKSHSSGPGRCALCASLNGGS